MNRSIIGEFVTSIVDGNVAIFNYFGRDKESCFKYVSEYDSDAEAYLIKTIYEQFPSYKVLKSMDEIDDSYDFLIANIPFYKIKFVICIK